MSLETEVDKPIASVFRRAHIKRRQLSDGKYESGWEPITSWVVGWGSVESSIDDVRLNRFRHNGLNLTVSNQTGKFNDETNASSLFLDYLTRYRTLVRIQAGYTASDGTEYPTDTTQGIFILTDELETNAMDNKMVLRCSSLQSIFDEVKADSIPSLNVTLTAEGIVTRIRDHTDGSGNFIFREVITSTSWTIQSTSNYYFLTSTAIDGMTCWDLMSKLAEAEGFVLLINRTGGVEFRNRDPRTTTSAFSFKGQGYNRQNIIKLTAEKESLNKLYTFFRLKYLEADTSTSYVSTGTGTTVNTTNIAWKYGNRIYEFENTLVLNTATAQAITDNLFTSFSTVKKEIQFDAKMTPHLEVLDRIDVSYVSSAVHFNSLWDVLVWDTDKWSKEGVNFQYNAKNFKVLSRRLNLDNFAMTIRAREV